MKKFFSVFAIALGVLALTTTVSCKKENPTSSTLTLSKTSVTVEVGKPLQISATYNGTDVTSSATWTSSDEAVATVASGAVTGVKAGSATITVAYSGQSATCAVTVTGSSVVDKRLDGSQYVIVNMDETTYAKLTSDQISMDIRPTGSYDEGGALVPDDANGAIQIWNPGYEIVEWPNVGTNSFGRGDGWFGISSANPTPEGGWGNICGGFFLRNLNNTYYDQIKSKITSDHVFCIAFKGKYTSEKTMEIGMKVNGTEKWFIKYTESTGEEKDGDWTIVEVDASDIFDFSQLSGDEFFPLMYRAAGAGATVDIDAAFFYIPAE